MVSPAVEESVKVLAPSPYDLFLWGETVEMEALVLEEPLLFEAHRLKWSSINYVIENEILNTTSECANQHGVPGMVYCIEVSDFDAGENIIKLNIPTGIPLVYELDTKLNALKHYYLGDSIELEKKLADIVSQGKSN